jgi:hypothetical protein
MPSIVFAGDLAANDYVGVTFWIISISMVAATVFFYVRKIIELISQMANIIISNTALVTLIAAVHYFI